MRVALVCPYAWDRAGGVQTHVRSLARTLIRRGHDVTVVAPGERGQDGDVPTIIVGRSVNVPANGSIAPIAFGPRIAAATRAALRDFAPEIVHVHEPLVPSVSLLAVGAVDAAYIGTFHASTPSSLGYAVARPVLERVARGLAVRTAVSDAAATLASRYFPEEYLKTPNGVELQRFGAAPALRRGRNPKPRVLFVGRLDRRKGCEYLIQAMARVRDLDARLVVVGAGPRDRACRALARRLVVDAEFLGRVADDHLALRYASADLFCAPNTEGESFGIVLLEAMAAGAPVIASDLPGFREAAQQAARFVPVRDAAKLGMAIRAVLTDDDERARLRAAGKERAATLDWERLVMGVEEIYTRALSL